MTARGLSAKVVSLPAFVEVSKVFSFTLDIIDSVTMMRPLDIGWKVRVSCNISYIILFAHNSSLHGEKWRTYMK